MNPNDCPGCRILKPIETDDGVCCVATGEKRALFPATRPDWCPLQAWWMTAVELTRRIDGLTRKAARECEGEDHG